MKGMGIKMKLIRKRTLLIHLIGFIVARASFFSMNPLAIGYFMASYLGHTGGGLAFAAAFLGVITSMNATGILKYTLALLAIVIWMEIPIVKNKNVPRPILYLLSGIVICGFSLLEITSGASIGQTAGLAVLEGVIVMASAVLFQRGIDYLTQAQKGNKMNNEQMISIAVTVAVVIYAIPDFQSELFAPVETVVYFMILFFTYKYGVGQGTITGAVCGFALGLRGESVADVGILTMMGIIPAIFREMGRFPCAVIYLVTAALLGTMNGGRALSSKEIGALVAAVIVFLLLPGSLIDRVDAAGGTGRRELLASQNLRKIAKIRMRTFSESFMKLSKTLDIIAEKQTKLKQKEVNQIFEEVSEKLCKNCNQCSDCWERNFHQTYEAACLMFDVAEKKGRVHKEDLPTGFLDECISIDEFIVETNRGFEIAKLNYIWRNRISESREVIAEQLKEVSSVFQDITGSIYDSAEVSHLEEERVVRSLKSQHIITKDITILMREDKRKEIYLNAACRGVRCVTAKEAAAAISEALETRIKVSEASKSVITKEYDDFIFVEDTKFKVLTGIARAMKENVSGDNFSILNMETGKLMLALSDGMGTGKDASEESETVMALLEQMIEAGFKTETAIKLINSSLVLKADQQTFSTIDMGIINLFTGICEFIKIGAAAAFIRRGNWVETISSTTLPIGMFGNVDYDAVTKKLYEGDIIIMVTDGVLDCIDGENKEAFMENMIMELKSNNPQEIANRILDRTLSQSNYTPMDDMTVIAAGIWLK